MTYEDLKKIYQIVLKIYSYPHPTEFYSTNELYEYEQIQDDIEWMICCIDEELTLLEREYK